MRRLGIAFVLCFALCAVSWAAVWLWTRGYSHRALEFAFVAYAVPALAAAVLLSLVLTYPDILPGTRPAFPVNLTLPLLHGALVFAIVSLVTSQAVGIRKPNEALKISLAWTDWRLIGLTVLAQMVLLSVALPVFGGMRRTRRENH